ncbi:MAG TPA: hypothetical protein VHL53_09790, partial [Acidimicrobiia bacterium]|nr:hypothetical protein [Acidimicrobiia bacterium]
ARAAGSGSGGGSEDGATGFGDVDAYCTTSETPFGRLRHLAPVAQLPRTPARWEVPTSPIGTHPPAWAGPDSGTPPI